MTNEEFAERIQAAMLDEPAVARVVSMDYPEVLQITVPVEHEGETIRWSVNSGVPHPAPDLDAPQAVDNDTLIVRGFIQVKQASWVRLDAIETVQFNTGPGRDECWLHLVSGRDPFQLLDQEARDFWVAWTAYLAGDE